MIQIDNELVKRVKNSNIALIYGGNSPEHEVSIQSAQGVYKRLKKLCNKVYLIGISKSNMFYLQNYNNEIINDYIIYDKIKEINKLNLIPGKGIALDKKILDIDIAFPVTHGCFGEDGKLQGLLSICNILVCGCNTTSSSICMAKAHCSSILNDNGIKTIQSIVLDKYNKSINLQDVQKKLGKNLFIKSETTGSSIGVHALRQEDGSKFKEAIKDSFNYSNRVLIQPLYENFRELECAALEHNGKIIIAGPGCVVKPSKNELLSYKSKYAKINGAILNTSLDLDNSLQEKIREIAKNIFKILHLSGYSRIDFFLTENNEIILNEINTLPGITETSHYPQLIESSGISFDKALSLIIDGALNG